MTRKVGLIKILLITLVLMLVMVMSSSDKSMANFKEENLFLDSKIGSKEVMITAVGDIIVHSEQITAAYDNKSKQYDFNDNFKYVKKYIEQSDIAYGTIEGTYSGGQLGYSGYPIFNSPETMLTALKDAGFDLINAANDHILDKGIEGYTTTINNIKNLDLKCIGVSEKDDEDNFVIEKINGIKIGFTSCTFSEPNKDGKKALNNVYIPDELENNINVFSYSNLQDDLLKFKMQIDKIRDKGAEFIIVGVHWGNEYSVTPSKEQIEIAKVLNSYGVNLILGSHPHVIQPIERIHDEETGNETLVVYSLGNFLSNQRFETMGNSLAADGMILQIKISKTSRKKVDIESYDYIPTWVYKYKDENSKNKYSILPNEEVLASEDVKKLPEDIRQELERSINSTKSIIK